MTHEHLMKAIDKGWEYTGVFVLLALLAYIPKFIRYLEVKKRKKIDYLNKALKCEFITDLTKTHLQEELAIEYFRLCTNMNLERNRREAIIQLYNKHKGELSFINFKRALPHLVVRNGKVIVKITKIDSLFYIYNYIIGFFSILCSIGFMVYIKPLVSANPVNFFILFSAGVVLMVVGSSMLWQNFPMMSAKKIRRLIV